MKTNNCIACRFKKDGVKTRKALIHTCGRYNVYYPSRGMDTHLSDIKHKNSNVEIEYCNAFTDLEGKYKVPRLQRFWTYIIKIFKKKPH